MTQKMLEKRLAFEGPARLWWMSPMSKDLDRACALLDDQFYDRSEEDAYALLWMRPAWFGSPQFRYPDFTRWIPRCSIVSGTASRIYMGVLFSRHFDDEDKHVWKGLKSIWSTNGGSRSSETCKVILSKIFSEPGLVYDPYARSHLLPTWARRLNIGYRGYTENQGVRGKIEKELAQVEIPGIQQELPLLMKKGDLGNG